MKGIHLLVLVGNFVLLILSYILPSDPNMIIEETINMNIPIPYFLMYFVLMVIVYNSILYLFYKTRRRVEE